MPYRRLPNTDAARLKAMEMALNRSMKVSHTELAFSQKTLQRLRFFLPSFQQSLTLFREETKIQTDHGNNCRKAQQMAKMYLSHFIQVYNLAILRGEIPANTRKLYGLERFARRMPLFNTDQELIEWGQKIIDGESKRIAQGGTPLMSPRIALVKIKYDDFVKLQGDQKFTQMAYKRAHDKLVEIRIEADKIILDVWNEVEAHFENLKPNEKREQAALYGVAYVFRPSELEDEY